eukprot:CAMPEP_0173469508 /NCGR_PEP_ID=MMETSP1357-20121228/77399_1 /TAXON_ID=77926 /ORGANISM="Hemiselmis rufescens, Strain PCC563" /LENGTH=195 /DNA_ID=CAMNT_0014437753 /DNA_START=329 /DNA_END=916 /DNA_ORIENTATION=-
MAPASITAFISGPREFAVEVAYLGWLPRMMIPDMSEWNDLRSLPPPPNTSLILGPCRFSPQLDIMAPASITAFISGNPTSTQRQPQCVSHFHPNRVAKLLRGGSFGHLHEGEESDLQGVPPAIHHAEEGHIGRAHDTPVGVDPTVRVLQANRKHLDPLDRKRARPELDQAPPARRRRLWCQKWKHALLGEPFWGE